MLDDLNIWFIKGNHLNCDRKTYCQMFLQNMDKEGIICNCEKDGEIGGIICYFITFEFETGGR